MLLNDGAGRCRIYTASVRRGRESDGRQEVFVGRSNNSCYLCRKQLRCYTGFNAKIAGGCVRRGDHTLMIQSRMSDRQRVLL